jgi:hypothetical protein
MYSQIWLNFLVDDCYFGYMGEGEKKGKKKPLTSTMTKKKTLDRNYV